MQVAHHHRERHHPLHVLDQLWCANGEVAPFVGHKAFLRWFAMQDPSFVDLADDVQNQWSEVNVSEDLDLALRLLLNRYTLRWSTYSLCGFKEGVLTAVDELARWQKVCCWFLIFCILAHGLRRELVATRVSSTLPSSGGEAVPQLQGFVVHRTLAIHNWNGVL